ncbi:LacI family transcriptional regulator [Demequina sp. TTPB684]|uniref:LacI family DNA-binding transcriptional regulator n=1 Tax=unclassified Demequina TaxID=2620311 RepID=UPI001CF22F2F|nr:MULTISPECIES: LacI family DNA-binding transcriptional regulator [unclassified Demequina]MCB2413439.1 LacI family transcriptional regulator [Demequina sp. TTPB684]UPU88744.1 LacI family transcriptional regulator [Demequina sp. TMPB413]
MEAVGRVKLADVAAQAGVSVATVSKVVNGRYGVAKDTIALVQGVIDDLGYVGNLGASGLRSSRTNVVGILVADFEPYSAELIKGAAKATRNTQYDVLSYAGGEAPAWERRSLARLGGTLMDGAVVVTPTSLDSAISVPVVAVDPHYGPNWLPTIDSDGFGGAKSAANHLLELGHRRIAFLGGRQELDSSQLRESGFREAMRLAGVPIVDELVRYSRYDPDIAQDVADAFLALPEPPTAIIAANDVTAMSAMAAARARGLRVPEDVSIVGFDDIPDASLCDPPLTTVRQPLQAMGEAAMTMLLAILDGREHEQHIRMDTEFIVRASTAPPRAS